MVVKTFQSKAAMGRAAAAHAAAAISRAVTLFQRARVIAATGASQFEFLDSLTALPEIAWNRVELFHLDEYVGISIDHPASFRKYLLDRLINKVGVEKYHLLDAETDATAIIARVGRILNAAQVDVAFVGIGENAHLAFNDPPADFETADPYLLVSLDDECRRQQVGEGWFAALDDVPTRAISMSVNQILKSREIICVVPDERKASAVKRCLEGEVSALAPASILQTHQAVTIYLDRHSAALLKSETITDHIAE